MPFSNNNSCFQQESSAVAKNHPLLKMLPCLRLPSPRGQSPSKSQVSIYGTAPADTESKG